MKLLITGTASGLGKYLFETFGGIPWTRKISNTKRQKLKKEGVDIIIHAAFNSSKSVDSNNLYSYIEDNILLTEEITKIPHKKFIYISSVDVYPKNNKIHKESEVIDLSTVDGIYGIAKLMSESLIKNSSKNFLILRCTALLGKHSRKNSLIKIIKEKNPILTLSPTSSFNYILHSDVSEFIKLAIKEDLKGIYNLASSKNITLSEIAALLKKKINFGIYIYNVGHINNSKISSISPVFKQTSREVITEFRHTI